MSVAGKVGVGTAFAVGAGLLALSGSVLLREASQAEAHAAMRQAREAAAAEHAAITEPLHGRTEADLNVQRGESLALVLDRTGVPWREINAAMDAVGQVFDPHRVRPGQKIDVYYENADGGVRLTGLAFRPGVESSITVSRTAEGLFTAREIKTPLAFDTKRVVAKVQSSLYQSALAAGATEKEVSTLASVFAYDIDFQRDVFPGDPFELVFDRYADESGRTVKTGDLKFVALQVQGKPRAYYRFQAPGSSEAAWYDSDGRSARKFLMKTPVDGARLSSGFGMRLHPILGYSRMHKGVDFAAMTGTPIMAAGDGVIERAGVFSGYGNYVKVKHSDGYETAYGHMSRFAKGIRRGVRVRQSQVIGYVGSTGAATGPHLHYEILYRGGQINPMKLRVPTGSNLAGADLAAFQVERRKIDAIRAGHPAPAGAAIAAVASAVHGLE